MNLSKVALPSGALPMERYDSLPHSVRRILASDPYNVGIPEIWLDHIRLYGPNGWIDAYHKALPDVIRNSAALAYGPDHPQAK